jgi:hypothetical protein
MVAARGNPVNIVLTSLANGRVGHLSDTGIAMARTPFASLNAFHPRIFSMNIRNLIVAVALPALFAAGSTLAAEVHIRGEVVSAETSQIVVKAADGKTTTINLAPELKVLDVSQTSLDAIADKSYIGVAGVAASEGKVRALGVMVFPEGARGMNEGSFPWDIKKTSSMTNATVSRLLKQNGGAEIEVRYGENKKKSIQIDKETVFGTFVPGDRALVVKGAKVLIFADQAADGKSTGGLVMVGRNGFLPPI